MLLMYAECLAQCDQLNEALKYVDEVRARVGMKGLKTSITKSKAAVKPNMDNKQDVIE